MDSVKEEDADSIGKSCLGMRENSGGVRQEERGSLSRLGDGEAKVNQPHVLQGLGGE